MDRTQILARMTYGLGVLVLIAMALSVAALSDIGRGESDVSLEWTTLRITALLMLMFIGISFASLRSAMRKRRLSTDE